MLYELPLLSGGKEAGRAEYELTGVRLRIRCRMAGKDGIWKLYLCRDGRRSLLGTPAPAEGGLYLERTLSRSELERGQLWPPEYIEAQGLGTARTGSAVWQEVTPQALNLADPLLERLFRQGGWSWKRWEGGYVLSRVWRENTAVPAMPVFCFLRLERGRICCWLDGGGRPCFPPE